MKLTNDDKLFLTFLKRNNIYCEFFANRMRQYRVNIIQCISAMKSLSIDRKISSMFNWSLSPQKRDFWVQKNILWKICYKGNGSIKDIVNNCSIGEINTLLKSDEFKNEIEYYISFNEFEKIANDVIKEREDFYRRCCPSTYYHSIDYGRLYRSSTNTYSILEMVH